MDVKDLLKEIQPYDERWDVAIPGDHDAAIQFAIEHSIFLANESIKDHGFFTVALSGGSTPKAIYQGLCKPENRNRINWKKILFFWSDERCVPKDHPDSNYRMAMQAGFAQMPIPPENIFGLNGVGDLEKNALDYERLIQEKVPNASFDLIMLGMGEDGHTASLFPKTHGLHPTNRLVITNFVPQKDTWRMSFTFDLINSAKNIAIYALGPAKAKILKQVFNPPYEPDLLPIQRVGTPDHRALWILDRDAAALLDLSL